MRINCTPTPNENGWPAADDIKRIARIIAGRKRTTGVVLFGARARGEMTPQSDLDFIVLTTTRELQLERKRIEGLVGRNRTIDLAMTSELKRRETGTEGRKQP